MTHNLTVDPELFKLLQDGKIHLITKHKTTYATGDKLVVQVDGHRGELSFTISNIDMDEHIFKGWCLLILKPLQYNDLEGVNIAGAIQSGNEALLAQQ